MYQFSNSVIKRSGLLLLAALVLGACGGGGGGDGDPGPGPVSAWGARQSPIESDAVGSMANASVAFDGSGNAIAVWERSAGGITTIWANLYLVGTGWSAVPQQISGPATATAPHVAVNAAGTAVAVWRENDRIKARRYAIPTAVLDAVVDMGEARANAAVADEAPKPKVAVGASGDALVIWHEFNGTENKVFWGQYSGGSAGTQLLPGQGSNAAAYPQIAMDGNGNAIAVWVQLEGDERIRASRYTAAGSAWTMVADPLDNATATDAGAPQIAMNTSGNAIVVWRELSAGSNVIVARRFTGGVWSAEAVLNSGSVTNADVPQVAIDGTGNGIAVWTQTLGAKIRILASRFAAGAWSVAGAIDADNSGSSSGPKLAMNANGSAFVVWQSLDAAPNPTAIRSIWSNRFVAGWGPSTARSLESAPSDDAEQPHIAVDTNGRAIAVWQQVDGTVNSIYWARYQ
jgi:hypothetical protein